MTKTDATTRISSLTPLCERNYWLLIELIPVLRSINQPMSLILNDQPRSCISIVERTRYTSTLAVSHSFGADRSELLRDIQMQLRVYYDARLIEVLSYQNRSRLAPFYPFPNAQMLSPFEKRQVNLFLGEWLHWCIRHGRIFEHDPGGAHVSFC